MSSRRGHGEGATYLRESNQRWVTAVDLGFVEGTRKEVADKLKVVLREQQQNFPIATERQSVEQFLERWREVKVKPKNRPKT